VIDHIEVLVSDIARSTEFYRRALAPLGYSQRVTGQTNGFGASADRLDFWVRGGDPARPPPHFAFLCVTRGDVVAAHSAAIAAGGSDNGAPAVLERIHPDYFAGFVKDPDGHNVEFVCQAPVAQQATG
jgi:catechol 2,3-dioxygenase-like lactoylglutathione lyase family enzyme